MPTHVAGRTMTREEFLSLPEDGADRMLIKGLLWERSALIPTRDHIRLLTLLSNHLRNWFNRQPAPKGMFSWGGVAVQLRREPPSIVNFNAVVTSAESFARMTESVALLDCVPVLVAEILAPSGTVGETTAKVQECLDVGVAVVLLLDPRFRTVTVFRRDAEPELFNVRQQLTCEPHLPGFRVAVAELFED